jgi:hypothetical protein
MKWPCIGGVSRYQKKKKFLHTISNTQRACFSLPILLLSLDEWV